MSPSFEKRLREKLRPRDTCPHGNGLSLPSPADRRKKGHILLSEADLEKKYKIASVYERDRKLLEFLDRSGFPARHWAVLFVFFSPQQTLVELSLTFVVVALEKWKASGTPYCSFANSALACCKIGNLGSNVLPLGGCDHDPLLKTVQSGYLAIPFRSRRHSSGSRGRLADYSNKDQF